MVRGNSIHSLESSFVERALMPKGALIRPILVATSAVARANGRIAKKASKEFLHSFCWASEKGTSYFLSYLWMGKMIGIKWSKWSSTLLFYGGWNWTFVEKDLGWLMRKESSCGCSSLPSHEAEATQKETEFCYRLRYRFFDTRSWSCSSALAFSFLTGI